MTGVAIRKVLLIQPPAFTNRAKDDYHPYPPLGLAYVAAYLEKQNIEVRIIDAFVEGWDREEVVRADRLRVGLSFDDIERRVREFQPELVGVSSMFTVQSRNAHAVYELVKRVDPRIITVAGGNHATATAAESLQDRNLDYVVLGEGEVVLADLIRVLEAGGPVAGTKAVAYRDGDRTVVSPDRNFIDDLDELPFPARHLLPMDKYIKAGLSHGGYLRRGRYTPVLTSRGCPAKCTFCSISIVSGRKYRFRSPQNVVEELQQVIRDYGIEEVLFEDDNLTLNIPRAEKLFDAMTEANLNLVWNTPNGVAAFALTPLLIDKMKAAGCYRINLAIESGNEDVLRNVIKKPLKLERVPPLVHHARKVGIEVGAFLVVGMPGETLDQVRDSFRFVKNLKIFTPHVSIATPYPGTEMYELCVEKGYLLPGFSYDNFSIQYANIQTPDWTPQELQAVFEREQFLLRLHRYVRSPRILLAAVTESFRRDPRHFVGKLLTRVGMMLRASLGKR